MTWTVYHIKENTRILVDMGTRVITSPDDFFMWVHQEMPSTHPELMYQHVMAEEGQERAGVTGNDLTATPEPCSNHAHDAESPQNSGGNA